MTTAEATLIDQFLARVTLLPAARRAERAEALAALDPTAFEGRTPFIWMAEISNNQLDAYDTKMHESTLKNFAADSEKGVSFMNSHRTGGVISSAELPLGRSISGEFIDDGAGVYRVEAEFYTVPNLKLNDVNTDDFILGVRTGIIRSVSVGFSGGEYICSIDGMNMFGWSTRCPHYPGVDYDIMDEEGNVTGSQRAFAWIKDAHLVEVSAVYAGATPDAMIKKAQRLIDEGLLSSKVVSMLEQRYRMRFQTSGTLTGVEERKPLELPNRAKGDNPVTETKTDEQRVAEAAAARVNTIRAALIEAGFDCSTDADPITVLRGIKSEKAALAVLADDGRSYRAHLIEQAIIEGNRALHTDFEEESYRKDFESFSLDTIKRMTAGWKRIADDILQGGRVTPDKKKTGEQSEETSRASAAAFS